ncbi:MAG TPA: hypothetical protein PKK00_04985 [Bacteroidales bacterium]|nr:hypothetical protein [Bacteroidales bacterium]HPS16714.1 hypothetical protein [Bacteroidales bacterium]
MTKQVIKSELHAERASFKKLIIENPNYFGQIKKSNLKALKSASGNTTFEELTALGFNPETNQLEATISIKLQNGFSGSLCGFGSFEYVRFFLIMAQAGKTRVMSLSTYTISPLKPIALNTLKNL